MRRWRPPTCRLGDAATLPRKTVAAARWPPFAAIRRQNAGEPFCGTAHEPSRERMYERMHSVEGQAIYALRMHAAETPFAFLEVRHSIDNADELPKNEH